MRLPSAQDRASVEPESSPVAGWVNRGFWTAIEFEQSVSKKFKHVLREASRLPGYAELVVGKSRLVHRVIFAEKELDAFFGLFKSVAAWRSARFFINGDEVSRDDIRESIVCFIERSRGLSGRSLRCGQMAVRGWPLPDYFGCFRYRILLNRNPFYREEEGAFHWYEYGAVRTKRGKRYLSIDKEGMKRKVRLGYYCPNFKREWFEAALDALPDEIPLDGKKAQLEWREVVFPPAPKGASDLVKMRSGRKALPARSADYKRYLRDLFLRRRWETDR